MPRPNPSPFRDGNPSLPTPGAATAPSGCAAGGGAANPGARTASPYSRRLPQCCCSWRPFRPRSVPCGGRSGTRARGAAPRRRIRAARVCACACWNARSRSCASRDIGNVDLDGTTSASAPRPWSAVPELERLSWIDDRRRVRSSHVIASLQANQRLGLVDTLRQVGDRQHLQPGARTAAAGLLPAERHAAGALPAVARTARGRQGRFARRGAGRIFGRWTVPLWRAIRGRGAICGFAA